MKQLLSIILLMCPLISFTSMTQKPKPSKLRPPIPITVRERKFPALDEEKSELLYDRVFSKPNTLPTNSTPRHTDPALPTIIKQPSFNERTPISSTASSSWSTPCQQETVTQPSSDDDDDMLTSPACHNFLVHLILKLWNLL